MYLLYLHAGFMLTALGFILAGMKIAVSLRRRRWWFKAHRRAGLAGVAAMTSGFLLAIFMVSFSGSEHFDSPHPWLGALTFLSAVLTMVLGLSLFRFPARAAVLRKFHRSLGRFTAMIAVITALFGLFIAIL